MNDARDRVESRRLNELGLKEGSDEANEAIDKMWSEDTEYRRKNFWKEADTEYKSHSKVKNLKN